jgi:hypothetical protein
MDLNFSSMMRTAKIVATMVLLGELVLLYLIYITQAKPNNRYPKYIGIVAI